MQKVIIQNWGLIHFQDAWERQTELHQKLVSEKQLRRNQPKEQIQAPIHYLIFCQHLPVYTLGKTGKPEHLLISKDKLEGERVEFYEINRGGDITFHGPGQLVVYPIFDLDFFFTDIHKYIRYLEEAVIRTLKLFDVAADRIPNLTGVWLAPAGERPLRKICAIGVHLSKWVTMHGLAFNLNTDLQYFNNIVPCGIRDRDKSITSLANEIGQEISEDEIKNLLCQQFKDLFEFEIISVTNELGA